MIFPKAALLVIVIFLVFLNLFLLRRYLKQRHNRTSTIENFKKAYSTTSNNDTAHAKNKTGKSNHKDYNYYITKYNSSEDYVER